MWRRAVGNPCKLWSGTGAPRPCLELLPPPATACACLPPPPPPPPSHPPPLQVKPLRKQLTGLRAWITGQRKDQSPGTRMAVPVVEVDPVFQGLEGGPGSLIKYNPLSNITSAECWNFLRVMVRAVGEAALTARVSAGRGGVGRRRRRRRRRRQRRWWWWWRVWGCGPGSGEGGVQSRAARCRLRLCLGRGGPGALLLQGRGALEGDGLQLSAARPADHPPPCPTLASSLRRACPSTTSTPAATSPSAASPAPAQCCPTRRSARGAGGGRTPQR